MIGHEVAHLLIAKVGCTHTVLKSIVRGTWEHIVIWAELVELLQALHVRRVQEELAHWWQLDLAVNYIVNVVCFHCCGAKLLNRVDFPQLQVARLTVHVLQRQVRIAALRQVLLDFLVPTAAALVPHFELKISNCKSLNE